jgi:hypothetical protein
MTPALRSLGQARRLVPTQASMPRPRRPRRRFPDGAPRNLRPLAPAPAHRRTSLVRTNAFATPARCRRWRWLRRQSAPPTAPLPPQWGQGVMAFSNDAPQPLHRMVELVRFVDPFCLTSCRSPAARASQRQHRARGARASGPGAVRRSGLLAGRSFQRQNCHQRFTRLPRASSSITRI